MRNFRPFRKGFLLVFALLLSVFIAIIGFGMLGARKGNYAASRAAIEAVQAKALARSGVEDIRVKLSKNPFFPTGVGDEQTIFSYTEEVLTIDGRLVGQYQVVVDRTFRDSHRLVRIESTGIVGQSLASSSRHTMYAELFTEPGSFEFRIWQEGSLPRL